MRFHATVDGNVPFTAEEEAEWDYREANPPSKSREQLKQERQAIVDAITVIVNGKVFDGDEVSQTRMTRAIIGMQATNQPTLTWVLADNTATQATLIELTEALCLAGAAQAAVWVI